MNDQDHLTEDVRQMFADDSLDGTTRARAERHLAMCGECADDVARLRAFRNRVRGDPGAPPPASLAAGWPGIRSRIDAEKSATLVPPDREARPRVLRRVGWTAGIAAAIVAALALSLRSRPAPATMAAGPTDASPAAASDSTEMYRDEARLLLDRLQLQRSMLRPEALAAIDHDLAVVDSAIGELEVAIARDPRDSTLRSLLAMSYRRKVEILTRAENAG